MTNRPAQTAQELRQRAEELFRASESLIPELISPVETMRLLHELRVHQIELEMQNEELRFSQVELDASQSRYFDLYDLAPVGYLTISEKWLILEANLATATMLGVVRTDLLKKPMFKFFFPEDQTVYYRHLKQVVKAGELQTWEMRLKRVDNSHFWVELQATMAHNGEYWIALTDITKRKLMEENKL